MAHCLLLVVHCFVCSSTSPLRAGSQKPTRSSLYINYFDKNKNMRPGTDILHPTNLACLGPLARKRRFHRTSWRSPPSTHDATFSHITTAHEAREAGEAPSALTVYCITRVGVGANTPIGLNVTPSLATPSDEVIRRGGNEQQSWYLPHLPLLSPASSATIHVSGD